MVGRNLGDIYGYSPRPKGEVRLELDKVEAKGVRTPISLKVHAGEIVGLFGLVGAGRSELLKGLFGGTRLRGGQVILDGKPLPLREPIDAIRAGIMLCPEDRKAEGIIPVHSVRDNINISARRHNLTAGCLIKNGWENKNADSHIRSLNIKTPSADQLIMNLSGGNQQKAILGRWLSEDMKVILLDEPTRGIDVGAKHEIYNLIYRLANRGIAVLFASSDLPEVMGLADRIVVMREGAIAGELLHDDATEQQTLSLAMPKTTQSGRRGLTGDHHGFIYDLKYTAARFTRRPAVRSHLGQLRHAGGICTAVYCLCDFCAELRLVYQYERLRAGDVDVRHGRLRHAVLSGLR